MRGFQVNTYIYIYVHTGNGGNAINIYIYIPEIDVPYGHAREVGSFSRHREKCFPIKLTERAGLCLT